MIAAVELDNLCWHHCNYYYVEEYELRSFQYYFRFHNNWTSKVWTVTPPVQVQQLPTRKVVVVPKLKVLLVVVLANVNLQSQIQWCSDDDDGTHFHEYDAEDVEPDPPQCS